MKPNYYSFSLHKNTKVLIDNLSNKYSFKPISSSHFLIQEENRKSIVKLNEVFSYDNEPYVICSDTNQANLIIFDKNHGNLFTLTTNSIIIFILKILKNINFKQIKLHKIKNISIFFCCSLALMTLTEENKINEIQSNEENTSLVQQKNIYQLYLSTINYASEEKYIVEKQEILQNNIPSSYKKTIQKSKTNRQIQEKDHDFEKFFGMIQLHAK